VTHVTGFPIEITLPSKKVVFYMLNARFEGCRLRVTCLPEDCNTARLTPEEYDLLSTVVVAMSGRISDRFEPRWN
jgi:hypothetical protein